MSREDRSRYVVALGLWLKHAGTRPDGLKWREDRVNLADGRDFLEETEQYDLVVLHSIFHPRGEITDALRRDLAEKVGPAALLSPKHAVPAWKRRLEGCGAKHIIVCAGQPFTLDGWQLGELKAYEIAERDGLVTVYRRKA
jgi:hypothetical protein